MINLIKKIRRLFRHLSDLTLIDLGIRAETLYYFKSSCKDLKKIAKNLQLFSDNDK